MLVETGIFVETGGGSIRFWIGQDGMQASTDDNQPLPLDPKAELVMRPDVANPPLRHRDRGRGRDNRFER